MTNLNWAISTLKKCFVAPNTINSALLKDDFAFQVAMTQITNAVLAGEITKEEVEKQLSGTGVIQ